MADESIRLVVGVDVAGSAAGFAKGIGELVNKSEIKKGLALKVDIDQKSLTTITGKVKNLKTMLQKLDLSGTDSMTKSLDKLDLAIKNLNNKLKESKNLINSIDKSDNITKLAGSTTYQKSSSGSGNNSYQKSSNTSGITQSTNQVNQSVNQVSKSTNEVAQATSNVTKTTREASEAAGEAIKATAELDKATKSNIRTVALFTTAIKTMIQGSFTDSKGKAINPFLQISESVESLKSELTELKELIAEVNGYSVNSNAKNKSSTKKSGNNKSSSKSPELSGSDVGSTISEISNLETKLSELSQKFTEVFSKEIINDENNSELINIKSEISSVIDSLKNLSVSFNGGLNIGPEIEPLISKLNEVKQSILEITTLLNSSSINTSGSVILDPSSIDTIISKINELKDSMVQIVSALETFRNNLSQAFGDNGGMSNSLSEISQGINGIKESIEVLSNLNPENMTLMFDQLSSSMKIVESQIASISGLMNSVDFTKIGSITPVNISPESIDLIISKMEQMRSDISSVVSEITGLSDSMAKSFGEGKISSNIENLLSVFEKLVDITTTLDSKIEIISNDLKAFGSSNGSGISGIISSITLLNQALTELGLNLDQKLTSSSSESAASTETLSSGLNNAVSAITALGSALSSLDQLELISDALISLYTAFEDVFGVAKEKGGEPVLVFTNMHQEITRTIEALGRLGKKFSDLSDSLKGYSNLSNIESIVKAASEIETKTRDTKTGNERKYVKRSSMSKKINQGEKIISQFDNETLPVLRDVGIDAERVKELRECVDLLRISIEELGDSDDIAKSKSKQYLEVLELTKLAIKELAEANKGYINSNTARDAISKSYKTALGFDNDVDRFGISDDSEIYEKLKSNADEIIRVNTLLKENGEITAEDYNKLREAARNYEEIIKSISSSGDIEKRNERDGKSADNLAKRISNLRLEIIKYISANKERLTDSQIAELNGLLSDLGGENVNVAKIEEAFRSIQAGASLAGQDVETLGQKLKKSLGGKIFDKAVYLAYRELSQAIRIVYQNVVDLDSAVTDLQIATGYSKNATRELIQQYANLAKTLGSTTTEISAAADEWLRQGYSAEQSEKLITSSMQLSKLGQIESSEATVALTSAMKAYGVEVDNVSSIVDKLTAVDMKAATSAGDIATAMSETASSANLMGIGMDKLIGYLTVVQEVTQDSAESVGTFMKTTIARMGNIKAGSLIDPESSEDLSNVENTLKGVGIFLRTSGGEFRNFGEVLDEVASKWDSYGSVQQSAIAVAFGGTRNQNKFITLMEHYGEASEYARVSMESSGTAAKKFGDAYLTSIEAAKNSLVASGQAFSQSILNSDFLISAFKWLSKILDVTTKLVDSGAALPTILGVGGSAAGFVGVLKTAKDFGALVNSLNTVSDIGKEMSGMSNLALNILKYSDNAKIAKTATDLLSTGLKTAEGGAVSLSAVVKGFATSTLGAVTIAITAVIAVSYALYKIWDKLTLTTAELKDRINDSTGKIEEYSGEIDTLKDKADELREKIEKIKELQGITFENEKTIENYNLEIDRLETEIRLLEKKRELENKGRLEDANKIVENGNKKNLDSDIYWRDEPKKLSASDKFIAISDGVNAFETDSYMSKSEAVYAYSKSVSELTDQIEGYKKQQDNLDADSKEYADFENKIKNNEDLIDQYKTILLEISEDYQTAADAGNSEALNYLYVIDDAISSSSEKVQYYKDQLGAIKDNYKDESGNIDSTQIENYAAAIREAYSENERFQAVTKNMTDQQLVEWYEDMASGLDSYIEKTEEAKEETEKFVDSITKISNVSSAIGDIGKAFKEMESDGKVSFSTISSLISEMSEAGIDDSKIKEWSKTLSTANSNSKEFQQTLSDMTYAWLNAKMSTEDLAKADKDLVAAMLEEQGVANADAVAQYATNKAKESLASETDIASGKVLIYKKNLTEEGSQANLTKLEIYYLNASMTVFNKTNLDVSQKVEALRALAIEAGAASSAVYSALNALDINAETYKRYSAIYGDVALKDRANSYQQTDEWKNLYNEVAAERFYELVRNNVTTTDETPTVKYTPTVTNNVDNTNPSGSSAEDDAHQKHVDAYNEDRKKIDHYLKMEYITEEQHYAELARLYLKYYAGREEYADEAMAAEEELYETGTAIVEKWAGAAVDSVNAVADAMSSMVSTTVNLLNNLISANENSFNRYNSNLKHQLSMNYITEEQYYDKLNSMYKRYFMDKYIYLEQYQQYEEEVYEYEQEYLKNAASATEDIHAQVVTMIKDELQERKDAIEEIKDAYQELIDVRKEALNDQKDAEDYDKEHAEKLAKVAELQRQINALENDKSAAGQKKYNEVLSQLQDAQEELYDFEREHAYDLLNKQLEDQEKSLEESSSSQTDAINDLLEDNEWLVAEAWRRMDGYSDDLYQALIDHNKKYSTSIKDDITDSWEAAANAATKYGDTVNAALGYSNINSKIGESGMTDQEAASYDATVAIKNVAEYVGVFAEAISGYVTAGASMVSSFAGILNKVFPNTFTNILATGASGMSSAVGSGAGMLTSLTGFIGGLASGTSYASSTGVYRTDEFGEEAKFLKNTSDGRFTLLTKGSKVFTAGATERLAKILDNPSLLSGGLNSNVVSNIIDNAIPNAQITDSSVQNVTVSPTFNINGNDPASVANEVKGLLPTIADYTLDVIKRNARSSGRTRSVASIY